MKKLPIIILYVSSQERSTRFYEKVLGEAPVLNVPGMTEFMMNQSFKIGIMPEQGIAKIICPAVPHPDKGQGIPRCELYLFVSDPQLALENALQAGAVKISDAHLRNWGDTVAYCADPDGHIIAFAR